MDFHLQHAPLLSRVGVDRAEALRDDAAALNAGWADAALLTVDARSQVLIADGRVLLTDASDLADAPPADAIFLGRLARGRHVWAVRGELPAPTDSDAAVEVLNLRRAGLVFDDVSAELVSAATALLNWHDRARFSPVGGAPTEPVRGGWARRDPATGDEQYPRIDPAIICLIHDGGDRAVLARQDTWLPRLFALIAGFVEPGESFEAGVVREVREEIGLTVHDVCYLGSQPWPFPRSLMVGFHAVGDPDQPFSFSDGEIAEAAWFSRAEVRAALDAGDWTSHSESGLLLPPSASIARVMVESWAAAPARPPG